MEDNQCKDCALRLFNKNKIVGRGNPNYGIVIVIPSVDKNAIKHEDITFDEMVQDLIDVIRSSTGGVQLLDWVYVTALVKCAESKRCPISEDIQDKCFSEFVDEYNKYATRAILMLGKNTYQMFNDLNNARYTNGKPFCNCFRAISWGWNYSPAIKYYDEKKYEQFKSVLLNWFNKTIAKI